LAGKENKEYKAVLSLDFKNKLFFRPDAIPALGYWGNGGLGEWEKQ
jgi:hypothetical protein